MGFTVGLIIGLLIGWLFIPCPQFVKDGYDKFGAWWRARNNKLP